MHTPERAQELSTSEKEFQAEMVSYVVANRHNIDTEEFTLSYLANWTQGAELKDKERLLNEVRSTASEFIDEIDSHFDQVKQKELQQSKADDIAYNLTDQALKAHASHSGEELDNKEPAMFIHGISNDFQPFGKVNNLDFDQYKQERTAYTVAIPQDTGLTLVISSQYEKGEYIHPLHQLDKEQLVNKETYTTLENGYHDVLLKQDEDYIQSFAARLRTEIYQEKAPAAEKKKQNTKTNAIEIER